MNQQSYFEKHLNLNVRGLPVSATLGINELSNKLRAEGKQVFKMGLGQSPFPVPQPV
ncbi:MAG: aspartate aminotransferase, partial [Gammaproteobacteria bacterium]|nr:aspartate aminotransferase [Gammaproteobacteria bacterium]NIQ08631.1 aspartate aminotransferase [Gammaproteobacteria bacterium]NIR52704.1 aspartate aminotransferase [candidate division KSB1 bacterium]NIY20181.1 aspartate aminotransferase [Gammaproteobacteria bacterium]